MMELLAAYSVQEIAAFIVMLALAIKGSWDFIDWCKLKYKQKFDKDYKEINKEKMWEEYHTQYEQQRIETMECIDRLNNKVDDLIDTCNKRFEEVGRKIDLLTRSDMDDIRSWLVEKFNYYKDHPDEKIDEFIMDTIERRFEHYKEEGGNSYIASVVDKLREMYKED